MALKDRLTKLGRTIEGKEIPIPQQGGPLKRFTRRELKEGFLNAVDRTAGRAPAEEVHPVCRAARNSSDPKWRDSGYVLYPPEYPVEDLSEPSGATQ